MSQIDFAAMDFAAMTRDEALDILVELDVTLWGECERAASRRLHGGKSRGRLINSIVHHQSADFGDAFSPASRKSAAAQLSQDDLAELRKGG